MALILPPLCFYKKRRGVGVRKGFSHAEETCYKGIALAFFLKPVMDLNSPWKGLMSWQYFLIEGVFVLLLICFILIVLG